MLDVGQCSSLVLWNTHQNGKWFIKVTCQHNFGASKLEGVLANDSKASAKPVQPVACCNARGFRSKHAPLEKYRFFNENDAL